MNQLSLLFFAASEKINAADSNIPTLSGDALLTNILNLAYFIAGLVAVVVIIVAGIMYTSSSGDSGRVSIAKNALTYALVGLIVVVSAFVLTNFVIGRFV